MQKNDPDYIKWLLTMNDRAVERAIIAIYKRQTDDEKSCEKTRHHNGIGFNGADARLGSYYAKWIINGNHLTEDHLHKARAISNKYIRQLVEIATHNLNKADEERQAIQSES